MKCKFIPIDYDYFDFQGKNYLKIIGRDLTGKRICVVDSCPVYFWAILEKGVSKKRINEIISKVEKIKLEVKGRNTRVEKVELHNKKFLEKDVQALKIFGTNYKDLHDIATQLDSSEITKRRGYDLGLITHYIIEKKFEPLKWYEIEGEVIDNSEELGGIGMHMEVDTTILLSGLREVKEELFEPRVLAYDLETDELQIGEGEIVMLSLASRNYKKVITWKKGETKQDFVEYVEDEAEMLERFVECVKEFSPDFLVGYYSDGFDLPYLKARADKYNVNLSLGLDGTQPRFSRGNQLVGKIKGIVHLDLLKFIRTAYAQYMKSETMSLNEVAKEFLGEVKTDFKLKHSSDIKENEWEEYYGYNLQDSVLTYRLFEKFWLDMLEFVRVVNEPIFNVSRFGLSKHIESYMLHNLYKFNEIPEKQPNFNEINGRKDLGGVKGAFVYEPKPGMYEDIAMFDFTSMHTSIIISMNLSKGTLLEKREKNSTESPEVEDGTGEKYYFTKEPGFFPTLLNELFLKRKKAKADYNKDPNVLTKARSNAFKVLSASAHGYIGFYGARYYSHETSASILAFVRKFNQDIIKRVEDEGFTVIFGDSVGEDTKVIVREKGKVREDLIKNLFVNVDKVGLFGKEYNFKNNIEILTLDKKGNSVFRPLIYTMRHKCGKKMYRVHFTNDWSIDVTEDHSLMGYQAYNFNQSKKNKENPLDRIIEVKPMEIKKKLNSIISLKKIPFENLSEKEYPKEVYELFGFFIGDGSFCRNCFQKKVNKDYSLGLSLGKDKEEIIEKLINPLIELGYIKSYWESNTREGDIKFNGLKLMKIVSRDFRSEKGKKIIPSWMFEEKDENIASFLRGLFSADGSVMIRNNAPIIKYTSISRDYICAVRKLLYRVGISHSVFRDNLPNTYKTKDKVYSTGSHSKNILIKDKESFSKKIGFILERKNKRANIKLNSVQKKSIRGFEFDLQGVKKIEEIIPPKYVYDLEVEDTHRFFANYVLAHNTDSVAFAMNGRSKLEIKKFLKELNESLPGVMSLELEGFFKRGLWVTTRGGKTGAKKKYAMVDYDNNLKIRGFETVRRDWCKLSREVQSNVIRMILEEGNSKKALSYVKEIVKKIKERKVDLSELVIKTQLKRPLTEYKANTPHILAARRMVEHEIPISVGTLIEYYIAESNTKSKLVRDKVKLLTEKGEYNLEYYLEKQILPAVENIFQVFDVDIKELIDGKKQDNLDKWF